MKLFNQRPKEKKTEEEKSVTRKLWGVDFHVVENGLDESQVVDFVNELMRQYEASTPASVRSILKNAVTSAEKIAATVKARATVEAQEEAARIIAEANQKASAVKAAPAAGGDGATTAEELLTAIGVDKPEREIDYSQMNIDGQTPFAGEIELVIDVPVDLKTVSALYSTLQTVSELRILNTRGSAARGTVITVVLNKPMPLISLISAKMPNVELIVEAPSKEGGKPGLLGQGKKPPARRIRFVQKA